MENLIYPQNLLKYSDIRFDSLVFTKSDLLKFGI